MSRGAGCKNRKTIPAGTSPSPRAPTTGLRQRGNDTTRNTGRSGRQKALTPRIVRREERVTVKGPVKRPQTDGMSHRGGLCTQNVQKTGMALPFPPVPLNPCPPIPPFQPFAIRPSGAL